MNGPIRLRQHGTLFSFLQKDLISSALPEAIFPTKRRIT
jgi:hypothetical protein